MQMKDNKRDRQFRRIKAGFLYRQPVNMDCGQPVNIISNIVLNSTIKNSSLISGGMFC
jgi:hypothetical protein